MMKKLLLSILVMVMPLAFVLGGPAYSSETAAPSELVLQQVKGKKLTAQQEKRLGEKIDKLTKRIEKKIERKKARDKVSPGRVGFALILAGLLLGLIGIAVGSTLITIGVIVLVVGLALWLFGVI